MRLKRNASSVVSGLTLGLLFVLLTGALITGGTSGLNADVDAVSKALRVTLYGADGNPQGQKPTYRAGTDGTVVAAASAAAPFFALCGSSSKTLRVQWVRITGPTTATLAIQGYTLRKYSAAPTGGTPVTLTQVPMDSNSPAGTSNLAVVYTAAPTAGTTVGVIASARVINKSTTVVDSSMADTVFDFRSGLESSAAVLRGTAQCVAAQLHVATATTVSVHVEWTEE